MMMVYVPVGEFVMGSPPGEGEDNERPQHTVTLADFWMDGHEVTNAQFANFLNKAGNQTEGGATWLKTNDKNIRIQQNGSEWQPTPGYENHPVVGVTWYGARAYCLQQGSRLPTEAEWEKAARGINGQPYPWGDLPPNCDLGNYWVEDSCVNNTTAVGSFLAGRSPYGALDMAGNVWEWVADWYAADYYAISPAVSPLGPESGSTKVIRSGSWSNLGTFARTAFRGYLDPASINYNVGFRCAQD
jgi:formylglycine-generating enzyme required for sulfatase activity